MCHCWQGGGGDHGAGQGDSARPRADPAPPQEPFRCASYRAARVVTYCGPLGTWGEGRLGRLVVGRECLPS